MSGLIYDIWMRFSPSTHLFVNVMNCSFFRTERIVHCIEKQISISILLIYIEAPGSVAFYLLPNTEKLDLFRHKRISCEGLFIEYTSVDMY